MGFSLLRFSDGVLFVEVLLDWVLFVEVLLDEVLLHNLGNK